MPLPSEFAIEVFLSTLGAVVVFVLVLAGVVALAAINTFGWRRYERVRQRIKNNLFYLRADVWPMQHPRQTVEEEPAKLVFIRDNSLDDELLRIIVELREPRYDPARPRDESGTPSIPEF